MPRIKFSEKWDKLDTDRFQVDNEFTTFRGYRPSKATWYEKNNGNVFDVYCEGDRIGKARLVSIDYRWADDLSLEEIKNDTYATYTRRDFESVCKRYYKTSKVFGLWMRFVVTESIYD